MEVAKADVERHQAFWNGFVRFIIYTLASTVIILGLMAIFLL